MNRATFREQIVNSFDLEELRTLCVDLRIDFDSLRGEGKVAKVREMLGVLEREGRNQELVEALRKYRPKLIWETPKPTGELTRTNTSSNYDLDMIWDYIQRYPLLEKFLVEDRSNVPILYKDTIEGISRVIERPSQGSSVVAVLGSGLKTRRHRKELCEFVGTILGRSNHILIHGSGGVGREVARVFNKINPKSGRILNYTAKRDIPFPFGAMVYFDDLEQMRRVMTNYADFCLVIGGGSGTAQEIKMAMELGKKVYVFKEELIAQKEDVNRSQSNRLVIFSTSEQTTELRATQNGLEFHLSDYRPNRKKGLQWILPVGELKNITINEIKVYDSNVRPDERGFFAIGPRQDLYYSKSLFLTEKQLRDALRSLIKICLDLAEKGDV